MHIAVLLYGRIANYKEHYSHLLYVLGKENTVDFFFSCDNAPEEDIHAFIDIYKPIYINNEPIERKFNFEQYPNYYNSTNFHRMEPHFVNKERVFTLLEKHIHLTKIAYDIVFCTRLDMVYSKKILFAPIQENTIYIPDDITHYYDNWMNDHFAYGSFDVMKKYSNLYNRCGYLLDNGKSLAHPEALTFANLEDYSIQVIRFRIPYDIERSPYTNERPFYGILSD
jgi:hypothetical protein